MIGDRGQRLVSSIGFCRLFGLSSSLRALGLSRARDEVWYILSGPRPTASPPSSQSKIRQSSSGSAGQAVSKSGVKTSSHSPSHRQKSLVHTSGSAHQLPSKNAPSTAVHTTSHLPTDRYHNQRTTGGKNNNVVPKYILRSRMSPLGPYFRQTVASEGSKGSVHLPA